jgi:hypothetical protein
MATARRQVRRAASAPTRSANPEIEELSRRLTALEKSLPDFAAQGVELEFSLSGAGSQTLQHGLGREPLGFIVTYINFPGAAGTWCGNGYDSRILYFYCSVAATGRIWVY